MHPVEEFSIAHTMEFVRHFTDEDVRLIRIKDGTERTLSSLLFEAFQEIRAQLPLGQDFALLDFLQIHTLSEKVFFHQLKNFLELFYGYLIYPMEDTPKNHRHFIETLNNTFNGQYLDLETPIQPNVYFVLTPVDTTRSNSQLLLTNDKIQSYRQLPFLGGHKNE